MSQANCKDIELAHGQLDALIAEAEQGRVTVLTRRGRPVAAIVPVAWVTGEQRQRSLVGLAGSGRGLWGKDSSKALRRLRDESIR